MPTILLVRHGETDWNRAGQIMGERPIPLNQRGEGQVGRLSAVLEPGTVRALYSSPVLRARQTASVLAAALRLPLREEDGLREIGVGDWEGKFWTELADDLVRHQFYTHPRDARPPGGETLGEVQVRAVSAVQRALAADGDPPDARLMFVTHADVIRAVLAHYLALDLERIRRMRIDHASVTALALGEDYADQLFVNFTPLPEALK